MCIRCVKIFVNVYKLTRGHNGEHKNHLEIKTCPECEKKYTAQAPEVSIFRFRPTRSVKIVKDVLGNVPLPGVLVVDRYNGYNQAPCKIQYCFAHLLRNVQDLEKKNTKYLS